MRLQLRSPRSATASLALAALALSAGSATTARGQGIARPAGWRVVVDAGAKDTVSHVPMPPGWHMTTGPGALFFDPAYHAAGRFTVEADIFLFPGKSQAGYGVFVGGQSLDGTSPSYLAFVIRRDGQAALEHVTNGKTTALIPWSVSASVKPHAGGDEPVLNAIALTVDRDSIIFEANGKRVGSVGRGALDLDGTFGFRAGPDVNLHASRLDLKTRLAPVPPPKKKLG
jgi:hypothetical protein